MRNTAWVKRLTGERVILQLPAWLATRNHVPAALPCRIRSVTEKALGVWPYDTGPTVWFPLSQVERITQEERSDDNPAYTNA